MISKKRDERLKCKLRYCLVKKKMIQFYYCCYECNEHCKNPEGKYMGKNKPHVHGVVIK
jgi:hypothetical protein